IAHLYNADAARHGGKVEAVYTSKNANDCAEGACVLDFERGVAGGIPKNPWQTDTCVGSWHYDRPTFEAKRYKTPKLVIDMLVDIVSRNGNLMLNFPLPNSGELDSEELKILDEVTKWMAVNSEGIYGTRPWKVFGDSAVKEAPGEGAAFNEGKRRTLTAEDVRFTTKGKTLYAFVMGWPEKEVTLKSLATAGPNGPLKTNNVQLLGFKVRQKNLWVSSGSGSLPSE
ncbi:MAG: alpha-L-fucosidase, partial [candidate division NC10 bacterium]